jgi:hypothetical protein
MSVRTRTVTATVATTSPLTVNMDGEDPAVNVPALRASSYTATVGDRVRLEIRTPLAPFILGKVT